MHGVQAAAYDGEGAEGQFTQYEGTRDQNGRLLDQNNRLVVEQDPLVGCVPFDIKDVRERDAVANLARTPYDLVYMDFPGGTLDQIKAIGQSEDSVEDLVGLWTDAGFRVVVVVPIGPLMNSIRSVGKAMDYFIGSEILVAMMGAFCEEQKDFVLYYGYEDALGQSKGGVTRKRLIEEGHREIFIPNLSPSTYSLLDEQSLAYDRALLDPATLLGDSLRIKGWLRKFREALPSDLASVICGEVPAA